MKTTTGSDNQFIIFAFCPLEVSNPVLSGFPPLNPRDRLRPDPRADQKERIRGLSYGTINFVYGMRNGMPGSGLNMSSRWRQMFAVGLVFTQMFSLVGVQVWIRYSLELVDHYQVHCHEEGSLPFMDFMDLHYGPGTSEHHADHPHEGLPFQTQDAAIAIPLIIPALKSLVGICSLLLPAEKPSFLVDNLPFWHFRIAPDDFWQPPRAV